MAFLLKVGIHLNEIINLIDAYFKIYIYLSINHMVPWFKLTVDIFL